MSEEISDEEYITRWLGAFVESAPLSGYALSQRDVTNLCRVRGLLESQAARIAELDPVEYANVYPCSKTKLSLGAWRKSRKACENNKDPDRIAIATRKGGKVSIEAVSDE